MKKIKCISLPILILCCFYSNISSAQNVEKQNHNDWELHWKFGYSQFMALNDFSRYLKGGAGVQTEIGVPYKKFEFSASVNANFPKAKNDFILNNNIVNINDKMEADMVGFSAYYAVLYTDYLKISPITGIVWCSLFKDENRPQYIFTETIGLQIESHVNIGNGSRLPIYLKYNYCFPQRYGNEINSGMHFISIGFILVIARW